DRTLSFFFSSRRRHTRSYGDWSSDVCSSDLPAASIGHRALAVNLSDLAAMGARAAWALLALTIPRAEEAWLAEFAAGLAALARGIGRASGRGRGWAVGGGACWREKEAERVRS